MDAMKNLMKTKKFDKIKVKDITSEANINRSTFYYHFEDKYDLLNKILNKELEYLVQNYNITNLNDNIKESGNKGILHLLRYFNQNASFYNNAFEIEGWDALQKYFKKRIKDLFLMWIEELASNDKPSVSKEFLADFYTSAYTGIVIDWLKNKMGESPEEVFYQLKTITENGFFDCINK
jgi:probable dihydroxyacetone kinase regulator